MIGLLILGQKDFGAGLIRAVEHTLGERPASIEAVAIDYNQTPEQIGALLKGQVQHVDQGEGILILADIYGATHTNIACRLLRRGQVELITGVNLPMLLRVLNYRELPLDDLIDRALSGGCGGIVCAANPGDFVVAKNVPGGGQ